MAVLISAFLIAAYLFVGKNLIHYHGEQTLYCAAEGRPQSLCLRELRLRLKRQLPWGEIVKAHLEGDRKSWVLKIHWRWGELIFRAERRLKVSSLSSWSR